MSLAAAEAALERLDTDHSLVAELDGIKDDPAAVLARLHAEGFAFTPDEMREAVLEQYGTELSPEHLDAIAAGSDDINWGEAGIIGGSTAGGVLAGAAGVLIALCL